MDLIIPAGKNELNVELRAAAGAAVVARTDPVSRHKQDRERVGVTPRPRHGQRQFVPAFARRADDPPGLLA